MLLFWISLAIVLLFLSGLTIYFLSVFREEKKRTLAGKNDSLLYAKELREREKERTAKKTASGSIRRIFGFVLDAVLAFLSALFLLSLADKTINSFELPFQTAVIATGSMSEKNPKNEYLFANDLDDQLQVNDWIGLRKVNSLDEIQVYDIISYVNDDGLEIVHRVVEKEEGYLRTRGDANESTDSMKIALKDVVGVYTGFRIPKIGILVFFAQSNYGILAFVSVFYLLVLYEILSVRNQRAAEIRIQFLDSKVLQLDNFTLISESGTLFFRKTSFLYDDEKTKDGDTLLQTDQQETILPESDYKQWKTN